MLTSVSVIGLGKPGAPLAACFAARGFNVHAVDINPQKVDSINRSVPPVHEPGLAELLRESGGRISATRHIEPAVRASDATFVVVATPSEQDGGFSLRYALPTCEAIGRALATKKTFHLVILTSTVMPGSTGHQKVRTAIPRHRTKDSRPYVFAVVVDRYIAIHLLYACPRAHWAGAIWRCAGCKRGPQGGGGTSARTGSGGNS